MNRKIRTWVEISLNDLEHNYREISSRLPDGCQMLGVCKANAYGHGAVRVAQRLQRAGCQWVAVNCYDEAEELRAAGVTMNILLLGPQSANIAVDLATLGVTQAVGSIEYARELNRFLAGTGLRLDAHMKLETGMGRTGFDVHDDSHLDEMIEALSLPHLNFTGVFTHFAVSDENGDPYTQLQFSRFTHAIERMEQATGHHFAIRHCANSGAVINYPEMHLDMVRPGLLLYGVHVLSAVLVGMLFAPRSGGLQPEERTQIAAVSLSQALPEAVRSSVRAVLTVSGFVVTFSVVTGILDASGLLPALVGTLAARLGLELHFARALCTGVLELGTGIGAMQGLTPTPGNLALAAFLIGWGGVSVHCQTAAVLADTDIKSARHMVGRLLHGAISALCMWVLANLF